MTDMDPEDLYDDIFAPGDQNKQTNFSEADITDLYDNIHNPEVAQTALEKVDSLSKDNEKYQEQIMVLKRQINILMPLNMELKTKNTTLEKNLKMLIETTRVEINRKNDQVTQLRSELDNVLYKRALRVMSKKELEDILWKTRPKEKENVKLPTQQRILPVKRTIEKVALQSPEPNAGNRQFVPKKRKRLSSENRPALKGKDVLKAGDKENLVASKLEPGSSAARVQRELSNDISLISNYVKGDRIKKQSSAVDSSSAKTNDTNSKTNSDILKPTDTTKIKCSTQVNGTDKRDNKKKDSSAVDSSSVKTSDSISKAKSSVFESSSVQTNDSNRNIKLSAVVSSSVQSNESNCTTITDILESKDNLKLRDSTTVIGSETHGKIKPSFVKSPSAQTNDLNSKRNDKSIEPNNSKKIRSSSAVTRSEDCESLKKKSSSAEALVHANATDFIIKPSSVDLSSEQANDSNCNKQNIGFLEPKEPTQIKSSSTATAYENCDRKKKESSSVESSLIKTNDSKSKTPAKKLDPKDVKKTTTVTSTRREYRPIPSITSSKALEINVKIKEGRISSVTENIQVSAQQTKEGGFENNSGLSGSNDKKHDLVEEVLFKETDKPIKTKTSVNYEIQSLANGGKIENKSTGSRSGGRRLDISSEGDHEMFGTAPWNCYIHKLGFRTRTELRLHSKSSPNCSANWMENKKKEGKEEKHDSLKNNNARSSARKQENNEIELPSKKDDNNKSINIEDFLKVEIKEEIDIDQAIDDGQTILMKKRTSIDGGLEEKNKNSDDKMLINPIEDSQDVATQAAANKGKIEPTINIKKNSKTKFDEDVKKKMAVIISSAVDKLVDQKLNEFDAEVIPNELEIAVRSITPTDDILQLGVFDEELDFEPEESGDEGGLESKSRVEFKHLSTEFSIPKVDKTKTGDVPDKSKTNTVLEKKEKAGSEIGYGKAKPSKSDKVTDDNKNSLRERSRDRVVRPRVKLSRRRRSRSSSKQRRSKSRNRSRSRNRRRSGRSPRKRSISRSRRRPARIDSKPRSLSRKRSLERRREIDKNRRKLAKRSQSCSPTRFEQFEEEEKEENGNEITKQINVELSSLNNFKMQENKVKKVTDDLEEGELSDSDDGEVEDILTRKPVNEIGTRKVVDLRQKLRSKHDRPDVKGSDTGNGSDKENRKVSVKEVKKSGNPQPVELKSCLEEYSADDIENKLIPFKKRQFKELQYEELKLMKQIERARSRSKSNTPVRSASESSIVEVSSSSIDQSKIKSPIKICISLKNVVIERPSSSSEETNVDSVVPNSHPDNTLAVPHDDNAVFANPNLAPTILDISHDLAMTDESDIEPDSPLKRARVQLKRALKSPCGLSSSSPLDLSSPRMAPPSTPVGAKSAKGDMSSPAGISNILKSPLVTGISILSPHQTAADVSFSQALTSTPHPSTTGSSNPFFKSLPPPPTPSFTSPEKKNKKSKKKKLGRSTSSSVQNVVHQ